MTACTRERAASGARTLQRALASGPNPPGQPLPRDVDPGDDPDQGKHQRTPVRRPNDRAGPGWGAGDLLLGTGTTSQLAPLVERTTRCVLLVRVPEDRPAERLAALLARTMETPPECMRYSITWDHGKEMARPADFPIRTGLPVCFCDPHLPWQRGSNENTNGLLRQYFPKGTDWSLGIRRMNLIESRRS